MLTFSLGKHLIHALAFGPDDGRLAVACGRRVAVLDWQAPGEPVWHEPVSRYQGCPVWLAFRSPGDGQLAQYGDPRLHDFTTRVGTGHRVRDSLLAGYGDPRLHECRSVLDFDLAGGRAVEPMSLPVSPSDTWRLDAPTVVAGAPSTAYLTTGHRDCLWHGFVVSVRGHATAVMAGTPGTLSPRGVARFDSPRAAWVVRQDRLLVWSEGFWHAPLELVQVVWES